MVLGGALADGSGWVALLPSGAGAIVVLAFTGGLLAWSISRRWEVFVLGTIAYAVAALWIRPWVVEEAAVLGGWLASATVGVALTLAEPDRTGDQRGVSRPRRPLPVTVIGVLLVAGGLGLLWWSASYHEHLTASLSTDAGWESPGGAADGVAERLPFDGDEGQADRTADHIRVALAILVAESPDAGEAEVHRALTPWARSNRSVEVSDSAVRTAGTGFGVRTPGGCIFGAVDQGAVQVQVGGYLDRGGCLAVTGQ